MQTFNQNSFFSRKIRIFKAQYFNFCYSEILEELTRNFNILLIMLAVCMYCLIILKAIQRLYNIQLLN